MNARRIGQGMDADEVARRDGKARNVFNVNEQHTFIHREYDIFLDRGRIGATGLLLIARLKPRIAPIETLPEFVLRWDEKANQLDVDPLAVSEAELGQFRKGTGDYYGHHADKVGSDPRVYEANIRWHGQPIYHGQIRFNLAREVETKSALRLHPYVSETANKGKGGADHEAGRPDEAGSE
jgi:hypothetical protein